MLETAPTCVARITSHQQVRDDLDQCGFSASELWNVGRYDVQGRWDEDGETPDEGELKRSRKTTNAVVTSVLIRSASFRRKRR
jgi:putative transposase